MDSFDTLPISCLINKKFLAIHGGLSPYLKTLKEINAIERFVEPPREGVYCDVLWSDPIDSDSGKSRNRWTKNDTRGCSYVYNADAVNAFLKRNKILSVIRAHEA